MKLRDLHFSRRSAAGRPRQALAGAHRGRGPRWHRLDRDAAHLHVEPARRRALRHHRQAGARLSRAARRRERQRGRRGRGRGPHFRGPTAAAGYWNQREKSRATFLGEWTRSGDKYSCDSEVSTPTRAAPTTCSRSPASTSRRSRSRRRSLRTRPCLERLSSGAEDAEKLVKPKAFVVLRGDARASEGVEDRAAAARQGQAGAVQISALDRVRGRVAERPPPARSSASSCAPGTSFDVCPPEPVSGSCYVK